MNYKKDHVNYKKQTSTDAETNPVIEMHMGHEDAGAAGHIMSIRRRVTTERY